MLEDGLSQEEVMTVIDRSVEELLQAAGVTEPPVDAIALAQRHLGMVICLDRRQVQRGRAQRTGLRRQIYLRPEPREERHQWTVAHEIGEHLKAGLLKRLGLEPAQTPVMAGESLANRFAYQLLAPTCWYSGDAAQLGYDLLALKRRYSTASHEVLAWRLLDLPEPCVITIVDNDRVYRRRSNLWPVRRTLQPAEQECQQRVHHTGLPQQVRDAGWTVQGWPVHQLDWKREILRSVFED